MKAVVIYKHGDPDVLKFDDLPEPQILQNEVVVQVKACALNHLDLWVRRGLPNLKLSYPHILGSDIAGVIVRAGELVENISEGTPVLVSPGLSCGQCEMCLQGRDNFCPSYKIYGEHVCGGYAQYVPVPVSNILPMPSNLSFEEAACIPLVFLTAHQMVVKRAKVQPGEWALVMAAGSGVGSACVQLAKLLGAKVIACAGSDEKIERAINTLGADYGVNYLKENLVEKVKNLTERRGVDVILDHTGSDFFTKEIYILAKSGRLVLCGSTSGFDAKMDLRYVFFKQLSILGSTMGSKGELFQIIQLIQDGKLKPVLDSTYPLQQAAEAHRKLESRNVFGKVVLKISQ